MESKDSGRKSSTSTPQKLNSNSDICHESQSNPVVDPKTESSFASYMNSNKTVEAYQDWLQRRTIGYMAKQPSGRAEEHADAIYVCGTESLMRKHLTAKYGKKVGGTFKIVPVKYSDITNWPTLANVCILLDLYSLEVYDYACTQDLLFNPPEECTEDPLGLIISAKHSRLLGEFSALATDIDSSVLGYTVDGNSRHERGVVVYSSHGIASAVNGRDTSAKGVKRFTFGELIKLGEAGISCVGDPMVIERIKRLKRWKETCELAILED